MKILRYDKNGNKHYGILIGEEKVLELSTIYEKYFTRAQLDDATIYNLDLLKELRKFLGKAERKEIERNSVSLKNVKIIAPLANPSKIICLGLNYRDHAEELRERGVKIPDEPVIFMKPRTAITGPNSPIVKPNFVKRLDYEGELAIIIGRKCKNVTVEEAKDQIFGFTIFNDVSAREIQIKDGQFTRGKGFDTFAPIGPWVVSYDQIGDPTNLRIRTWVNDELRQNSTTRNMIFNVYEIVSHLSRVMTLEPSDIIATGTPAGVGDLMKPEPKYLKHNDVVEIEIENIGKLRNIVIEEEYQSSSL